MLLRRKDCLQNTARRGTVRVSNPGAILSDRNIAALAPDAAGRLWVGYFDRGLDIVTGSFERVTHREDEHVFCVNRIVAAPDRQRIAVATANGLVIFDSSGTVRQVLARAEGLIADHVTDVAFSGNTLIAATPAGISFVGRDGIGSIYAFQGLVNNHVYTIAADANRLLAGTLGGLSMIEDGLVRTSYTTANSHLRHNWITALEKVDGEWFAGTYGAGVVVLDANAEWHGFPDLPKGLVVNPNALAVSATRVYAGSLGDGLYVYERAQKGWSRAVVGLPSLNVTAVAVTSGYLYAGTDNRADPRLRGEGSMRRVLILSINLAFSTVCSIASSGRRVRRCGCALPEGGSSPIRRYSRSTRCRSISSSMAVWRVQHPADLREPQLNGRGGAVYFRAAGRRDSFGFRGMGWHDANSRRHPGTETRREILQQAKSQVIDPGLVDG